MLLPHCAYWSACLMLLLLSALNVDLLLCACRLLHPCMLPLSVYSTILPPPQQPAAASVSIISCRGLHFIPVMSVEQVIKPKCMTTVGFFPSLCSQLPSLCSRAVQLGSLYVRGLSHLLGANCASGRPLPSAALMPWHSFDGRLFHSKYLLAHSGVDNTALLEGDVSDGGATEPSLLRSSADFI